MCPGNKLATVNNDDKEAPPSIPPSKIILAIIDVGMNPKKYKLNINPSNCGFWQRVQKIEPFQTLFNGMSICELHYYWSLILHEGCFEDYIKLLECKKWLIDYCELPLAVIFSTCRNYLKGVIYNSFEDYFIVRAKFPDKIEKIKKLIENRNKSKI